MVLLKIGDIFPCLFMTLSEWERAKRKTNAKREKERVLSPVFSCALFFQPRTEILEQAGLSCSKADSAIHRINHYPEDKY